MNRLIKHTILVITYNQCDTLPICLNSILNEEVLPYEIIIGDDCSTDNTWDLILEFQSRFPSIIKAYRNEINLGVFGNWNKLMTQASGEIVSLIAGDDFFKPGLLNCLNKEINNHNLNGREERFILVTNSITLKESGQEELYNNYQLKNENIFKARIRYGISYREVGISRKLFDDLDPIRNDLGYHADWIYIIDQVYKCDDFYFINEAFSVYRLGSGVTSSSKTNNLIESKLKVIEVIKSKYNDKLDNQDLRFLAYWKARHVYLLNKSSKNYLKLAYWQFINICNFTPNNSFLFNFKILFSGPIRQILRNL